MIASFVLFAVLAQDVAPKPAEVDEESGIIRSLSPDAGSDGLDVLAPRETSDAGTAEEVHVVELDAEESPRVSTTNRLRTTRRTFLTVHAIGGVGAGVLIIPAPAPFAAPWGGFGARAEREISDSSFLALDGAFSLGNDELGKPIGGYHLYAEAGTAWIDTRFFVLESTLRGGVTSYLLVPLPLLGSITSATLQPIRSEHVRWRIGLDAGVDFVLFLPVISGGAFSELRFQFGLVHCGLKVGGGYSLGVFNGAGVAASAKLFGGVSF